MENTRIILDPGSTIFESNNSVQIPFTIIIEKNGIYTIHKTIKFYDYVIWCTYSTISRQVMQKQLVRYKTSLGIIYVSDGVIFSEKFEPIATFNRHRLAPIQIKFGYFTNKAKLEFLKKIWSRYYRRSDFEFVDDLNVKVYYIKSNIKCSDDRQELSHQIKNYVTTTFASSAQRVS